MRTFWFSATLLLQLLAMIFMLANAATVFFCTTSLCSFARLAKTAACSETLYLSSIWVANAVTLFAVAFVSRAICQSARSTSARNSTNMVQPHYPDLLCRASHAPFQLHAQQ